MIRFLDIQRQTTWQKKVQINVDDIGRPCETDYGFYQCVQATDGVGRQEPLNYLYKDEMGRVEAIETGNQWYDIIWRKDKNHFECRPAEAPPKDEFEKNPNDEKWDKINLGKCRHGILCAMLSGSAKDNKIVEWKTGTIESVPYIDKRLLPIINELAHFSMTGEIE